MHSFDVHPLYRPLRDEDRIKQLCWDAREILATFMYVGSGADDRDIPDIDRNAVEDFEDGHVPPSEDLSESDFEDWAIHETPLVPFGPDRNASLSNLVYLWGPKDSLVAYPEPGYVALRTEPPVEDEICRVIQPEQGCAQLIFQLPTPNGAKAAIHVGYDLDESSRIKPEDTSKIRKVGRVLTVMRYGLRGMTEVNPDLYRELYHAQVPRLPMADLLTPEMFGE
jgi:hypothetical protein